MTFDSDNVIGATDTRNQKRVLRVPNKRHNHKEAETRAEKRAVRLGQFYIAYSKEALERHEEVTQAHKRKLRQIAKLKQEHVVVAQPPVPQQPTRGNCQLRQPQIGGQSIFRSKQQAATYFSYLKLSLGLS